MVKDKFSDRDNFVEVKLFPGLKVTSKYIPPEKSKSNLDISKLDFILNLSATFSDYFRKEIRTLHNNNLSNEVNNMENKIEREYGFKIDEGKILLDIHTA